MTDKLTCAGYKPFILDFWKDFDRVQLVCVIEFLLRRAVKKHNDVPWGDNFLTKILTCEDAFAVLEEELGKIK